MKFEGKKLVASGVFVLGLIAVIVLTQSGQHGQISGFVSGLLGG